jgi:hypothetical protein
LLLADHLSGTGEPRYCEAIERHYDLVVAGWLLAPGPNLEQLGAEGHYLCECRQDASAIVLRIRPILPDAQDA